MATIRIVQIVTIFIVLMAFTITPALFFCRTHKTFKTFILWKHITIRIH